MSLPIAIVLGSLICAAAAGLFFVVIRWSKVHDGRLEGLSESLTTAIEHLNTTSSEPAGLVSELIERMESFERRIETIQKDSLKYLQRGAAAEQRAAEIRDTRDEEPQVMTEEEARALIAAPVPAAGPARMSLSELEALPVGGGN